LRVGRALLDIAAPDRARAMPLTPRVVSQGKRLHDGNDVRAYPVAGEPYKKNNPQDFKQRLPDDESPPDETLQALSQPLQRPSLAGADRAAARSAASSSAAEAVTAVGAVAELAPPPLQVSDRFSVCIVGSGAIGCHIAYVLRRAGCDVTLIARGENLRVLRTEGLRITIGSEESIARIRVTDRPEEVGVVDYVFLTMKVPGWNSTVANMIQPLIGAHTTLLPPTTSIPYWWFHGMKGPLEGRRLERADPAGELWRAMPPEQVIGFTMWLSAVQTGPGCVTLRHVQRGYPLGELDGTKSRRVERLAAAFERGGIPSPRVPCIRSEIFIKSLNSLAFNVVAVLGNASNGVIADVPEAVETLLSIMEECEVVADVLGLSIAQSAESRIQQTLSARMHTMSMLHDLRIGKPLELSPLWTSFEDLATLLGVRLPLTKALVGVALLREQSEAVSRQACS